jgi:hypothetical protein
MLNQVFHAHEPGVSCDLAEPAGCLHGPVIGIRKGKSRVSSQVRTMRAHSTGDRSQRREESGDLLPAD